MQSFPHNNGNHNLKSYSSSDPSSKMITRGSLIILIIAVLLVIGLVISIVLIFTIGLKAARKNESVNETSYTGTDLALGPCKCGCPSIEPLFNDEKNETERIINGETALAHSWPWQLFLVVIDENQQEVLSCGASLITDRHVLTAANCVHGTFPQFIFLFPGQQNLNDITLEAVYTVDRIFIHESYSHFAYNDVAILTTEKPFRFDSHVSPICLADRNSPPLQANEELIVIGWGRNSSQPGTNIFPGNLQQVKVDYVPTSHPHCLGIAEPMYSIHPGEMCAGRPDYNVCNVDSGRPWMRRIRLRNTETYYWQQVGVVSKSVDCGWNSTWPDVYASVQYYYDWILSTIKRAN